MRGADMEVGGNGNGQRRSGPGRRREHQVPLLQPAGLEAEAPADDPKHQGGEGEPHAFHPGVSCAWAPLKTGAVDEPGANGEAEPWLVSTRVRDDA